MSDNGLDDVTSLGFSYTYHCSLLEYLQNPDAVEQVMLEEFKAKMKQVRMGFEQQTAALARRPTSAAGTEPEHGGAPVDK